MITITNLWALPLVMLVWATNAWLFALAARFLLGQLHSTRDSRITENLRAITDRPFHIVEDWLADLGKGQPRRLSVVVAVILAVLIVRYICLIALIHSAQ